MLIVRIISLLAFFILIMKNHFQKSRKKSNSNILIFHGWRKALLNRQKKAEITWKVFKKQTFKNEKAYKKYKHLFERLKQKEEPLR